MSRSELFQAALAAFRCGLNHGATGNLSVRAEGGMLITPSAVPYDRLLENDLVLATLDGDVGAGSRRPSSEWRLHAEIYRHRADVNAVLHAHPPFCTTLACLRQDLPAVHYMIGIAGGDRVRCSRYETFGTAELSVAALEALEQRRACLLANHGLLAVGTGLSEALTVAQEIEAVAEYWWRARAIGHPVELSAAEMAAAIERFSTYR